MSKLITIDIGNTNVKMAVFHENQIMEDVQIPCNHSVDIFNAFNLFTEKYPEAPVVGMCSGSPIKTIAQRVEWIRRDQPWPLRMMYESPQTLGMDRWLLANAVFLEHQSDLLVVTLGTCITYNVVKNGSFLGGAISPGLDLRFKAMNAFTAALPLVNSNPSATLLGTTTESSMQAGVNKAMAFEIQAMIDAYVNEFDLEKVIVCGGAINTLGNHLKNSIFAPSNYELYALQRIYEYFQNQ